jgi:hypothetical protein
MKSKLALITSAAALAGALVLSMNGAAQADLMLKPGTCQTVKVEDPTLGTVYRCIDHRSAVPLIQWNPQDRDDERQERGRSEEPRESGRDRERDRERDYPAPSDWRNEKMECEYGECQGTYRAPHPDSARP